MRNLGMSPRCAPRCIGSGCRMRWGFRRIWSSSLRALGSSGRPATDRRGRPRTRPRLIDGSRAVAVSARGPQLPAAAWRSIIVAQRDAAAVAAPGLPAIRVTPAHDVASGPPRAGSLAAVRGRSRTRRAHQVLLRASAAADVVARVGGRSRTSAGRSNSSIRNSNPNWGSIISRAAPIPAGSIMSS